MKDIRGTGECSEKERLFQYHYINTICITTNISFHKDTSDELKITKVHVQCLDFGTTVDENLLGW